MAEKEKGKAVATRSTKTGEVQAAAPARALSPFEEIDRFFESLLPRGFARPWRWDWPSMTETSMPFEGRMPRVDVIDRDNEVLVRAEVPGVDKKDLDVSVTESSVTIKGTASHEQKEEKGDYYRCEIARGSFSRTLRLPADVDGDKAKASFKDGVLELAIPKVVKAKRRSVKVD
jgi:HSP20 family protein